MAVLNAKLFTLDMFKLVV